jgi:hypothetical protein
VVVAIATVLAIACVPQEGPTSVVNARGEERHFTPPALRVVSHIEGAQSGLLARPFSVAFGSGKDGTELVERVLKNAEDEGAELVSDIAIVLATSNDSGAVECRSEVVPDTVSESHWTPGAFRQVPTSAPVTRLVTESQYQCRMVSHPEMRSVTEYQQRCHSVSRPVMHTRTSYSYQYDSFSHSSRSVPHNESYTTYESHQECRSEPISRLRTEYVSRNECHYQPVTHSVTRYEFQMKSEYVPPRLETIQRFRLKELEPRCYAIDAAPSPGADAEAAPAPAAAAFPAPSAPRENRLEAVYYFRK